MPANSRVVPLIIPAVTNQEFLELNFGNKWDQAMVTSFTRDPSDPNGPREDWNAWPAGSVINNPYFDQGNTYFCPSLLVPGTRDRIIENFQSLNVIVIDDIGTKVNLVEVVNLLRIRPTYMIETSPGNHQAGWKIEPETDLGWVKGMLTQLDHKLGGKADNLTNPIAWRRLPTGRNTKAAIGLPQGWTVRLKRGYPGPMIRGLDWPTDIEPMIGVITRLTTLSRGVGDGNRPDAADLARDPIYRALDEAGHILGEKLTSDKFWAATIKCPWIAGHGPTRPMTGAEYVPAVQGQRGWFHCFHCESRHQGEFREQLDIVLRDEGANIVAAFEFDEVDPAAIPPMRWQSRWQHGGKNGSGGPAANLFNVMAALRHAPEFADAFGFNAFTRRQILRRELPGVVPGTTPGVPREWRDQDTILLQNWLQGQGLRMVTSRTVDDAVNETMHEKTYHPVRDWVESLHWDHVPRLDTWVSTYLGTPQDPYHAHVGRWWLMTMCRRVFEPGCRADYMPVLEGPQGLEKSSMLRTLAGQPEWFSDSLPDLGTKDASEHLEGRWLIEIAEMDKFDRAESALMKAFVSRTTERYRRAYGRRTQDEPRQCMFAGTVNHHSYLKDETGNRRYWPVASGQLDLAGLALVRDQLFAEAWTRAVSQNEQYWPDPLFEHLFMQPEQDQRLEADLWEPLVAEFLRSRAQALVGEVVVACTGGGSLHLNTTNRNRVSRIMETLRWRRGKRGVNGERFWYPL
jgi:predicted P-loop ATPase